MLHTLDQAKVNTQRGQMSAPAVQDWINAPYLAVPEYYITASEKAAGNWGPALQKAIADVAAHGGGTVRLLPHAYHVMGQTLNVQAGVTIEGASHVSGVVPGNDYRSLPYAIILDRGYSINMSRNTALRRVAVTPSSLAWPSTPEEEVSTLKDWLNNGTAIQIVGKSELSNENANDVELSDLFILGFNQAIYTRWANRLRIDNIYGDNVNGLSLNYCLDICRIRNVHWNPFYNFNSWLGSWWVPVAAISNNGSGAIRVTVPSGWDFSNLLQNGWTVTAWSDKNNKGNINGKFTVNVVSATQFDLVGSTYTTDVSGGTSDNPMAKVYVDNTYRAGVGFYISHTAGINISDSYAGGYRIGFDIDEAAGWVFSQNNSVDGQFDPHDPDKVGVYVNGTASSLRWSGGYISSQHTPFLFNGTDTKLHIVEGVNIGATFGSGSKINSGAVQFIGNTFSGGEDIYISSAVTEASIFIGNYGIGSGGGNNSQIVTSSTVKPIVINPGGGGNFGSISGFDLFPHQVSKVSMLPMCNSDSQIGWQVFVQDMRKPGEAAGQGTGGLAVCTGNGTAGEYGWFSQFSGAAVED